MQIIANLKSEDGKYVTIQTIDGYVGMIRLIVDGHVYDMNRLELLEAVKRTCE